MSKQLQEYQFNNLQLRVIPDENGHPMFIAKDACELLGYSNTSDAIKKNCRESGIATSYIPELSNNYKLIDEGNLYRLVIKSTMPESNRFEDWVCDEVLPSIRETGGYKNSNIFTVETLEVENTELIDELDILRLENSTLKAQVTATQSELLDLYRYKTDTLTQQIPAPKTERKANRPMTENDINAIHTLREQGQSTSQIAKKIGRSTTAVHYVLKGAKLGEQS